MTRKEYEKILKRMEELRDANDASSIQFGIIAVLVLILVIVFTFA